MPGTNNEIKKRVLTEEEAANYICMSRSFLRQGRMNGQRKNRTCPPRHLKIGNKSIRYLIEDLDSWLDEFIIANELNKAKH